MSIRLKLTLATVILVVVVSLAWRGIRAWEDGKARRAAMVVTAGRINNFLHAALAQSMSKREKGAGINAALAALTAVPGFTGAAVTDMEGRAVWSAGSMTGAKEGRVLRDLIAAAGPTGSASETTARGVIILRLFPTEPSCRSCHPRAGPWVGAAATLADLDPSVRMASAHAHGVSVALSLGLLLAGVLGYFLFLRRALVEPLTELAGAISSADLENLADSRIAPGGKDEVGAVRRRFNELLDRAGSAEKKLKESDVRYRRLFEAARDGILILDAETGMIVDANPFLVELLGLSREHLLGKKIWEIGALKDAVANQAKFTELQTRGYVRYEGLPLVTHAGREIAVEFVSNVYLVEQGKVIQCNIRDNTERHEAEKAIREAYAMQRILNEMLHRSLADIPVQELLAKQLAELLSLPWLATEPKGAVFLMDGLSGTLVLTAQQGLTPAQVAVCGNVPVGRCLCGKAAELRQTVTSREIGPDHELVYEGMSPHGHCCVPIKSGDKVLGVLNLYLKEGAGLTRKQEAFLESVAEMLAANVIRSRVEEQLDQAQKMESVGRLAGGVAHDFNNLLTAINGYAGFVLEGLAQDDPRREDVQEILAAGERAAGLTRQLLAFSRRQILSPEVLDINAAVGGTVKMLKRLIGEDIEIETRLAALPCLAKVDPGQIDQVLLNLAVNARDAMPQGGTLTLETGITTSDEAFFTAQQDTPRGSLVCLTVRDTGCGMTDEVKRHLFEPFFTTKERGKGTGLGLPTVYGIIKQSGGDIRVESAPDRGTTWRIYFPRVETEFRDKDTDEDTAVVLRGNETVLLVEDEDIVRRLGERILTANGYTVLAAVSGPEALKAIERHAKPVDLLLTDVVMPGMSGRDLAQEIAKKNMTHRTLFISGYTDDAIVRHGVLEPGLAFLYKPFAPDALLRKIREVLDGPADQARA